MVVYNGETEFNKDGTYPLGLEVQRTDCLFQHEPPYESAKVSAAAPD